MNEIQTKAITLETHELRDALRKVCFIPVKEDSYGLPDILLARENGRALLRAADLEDTISVELHGEDDMGATLLPRRSTARFLTGADGSIIFVSSPDAKFITMKREGLGSVSLRIGDAPTLLPLPKDDNLVWYKVDAKWFCRALGWLIPACAIEDTRPVLTSISLKDGAMASADGFRLGVYKDARLSFGLQGKEALLYAKTANLVRRLFGKEEALEIALAHGDAGELTRVHFKAGNVELISQLCRGTFPIIEHLIPQSFQSKISFSVPLMAQRLGMIDIKEIAVSVIRFLFHKTDKDEDVCDIQTTTGEGVCDIQTTTGEDVCDIQTTTGEDTGYSLSLPIKIEEGVKAKIAFDIKYILDAIKPFSVCTLELNSSSSPGKFTGDIEGLIIIVMPMFVQW